MNKKQQKTLEAIFKQPIPSNIQWKEVESLFIAIGCEISEGAGSRVRVVYNDVRAVFHRPHPAPNLDKGMVRSIRKFIKNSGGDKNGL